MIVYFIHFILYLWFIQNLNFKINVSMTFAAMTCFFFRIFVIRSQYQLFFVLVVQITAQQKALQACQAGSTCYQSLANANANKSMLFRVLF